MTAMRTTTSSVTALIVAAAMAACASAPPTRYYTLLAADLPASPASSASAPNFSLSAVSLPGQADRTALVVRLDGTRLAVLDNARWAAPLGEELRGAFSQALSTRLGSVDVSSVAKGSAAPVLQIGLDVRQFELMPNRSASIDVVWSVRAAAPLAPGVLTCRSTRTSAVPGSDDSSLVQAQQASVAAIAEQIVRGVLTWTTQAPPACPAPAIQAKATS